ncbi:MAG TPA: STAS domain-containing protein [Nocardioides sp.]|nr:STAS domain-containing protein [Nocardioides sp.]
MTSSRSLETVRTGRIGFDPSPSACSVWPRERGNRADHTVLALPDAGLSEMIDDLYGRLELALEHGPRALVVDISAIGRLSSTTIAALLWTRRRCAARGTEMLLRRPSRRSWDRLRRFGLLGVLVVEPDEVPGGHQGRPRRPRRP